MWLAQVSRLLKVTPRYLPSSTVSRNRPCRVYDAGAAFLLAIWMTEHLLGLNSICQSDSHCSSDVRSDWRMRWSLVVVIALNSRQSSAKNLGDEFWTTSGRSLMYVRKRMGPWTVPWGTPDVTSAGEECTPSRSTSCFLSAKNDPIHLSVLSWTP